MTKSELAEAKRLAENGDAVGVDDSVLEGLYLPDFKHPVFTTLLVVARSMKDHIQFNGKWDTEALNEFCQVAKNRIRIV